MRNYGTLEATAVSLQDTFSHEPDITSVTVDTITAPYSYDISTGAFLFPSSPSTYSIPAATFEQDPATGIVTVTPTSRTLVVKATI